MEHRRRRSKNADKQLLEPQHVGYRQVRLEELVRKEIASLLRDEIRDQRLSGVELTRVELRPDGARARLWYTIAPALGPDNADKATIERALTRAVGFLRARLAEALPLKRVPELRFRWDPCAVHFGANQKA